MNEAWDIKYLHRWGAKSNQAILLIVLLFFFFFIYTVTHVTYVHIFGYLLRGQGILLKMLTLYNSEYSLRGSCGITPNLLYWNHTRASHLKMNESCHHYSHPWISTFALNCHCLRPKYLLSHLRSVCFNQFCCRAANVVGYTIEGLMGVHVLVVRCFSWSSGRRG